MEHKTWCPKYPGNVVVRTRFGAYGAVRVSIRHTGQVCECPANLTARRLRKMLAKAER